MTQDNQDEQEIEIEAIGIEVSVQPIELYKVFKIANLVAGGGEAKHLISEGYVAVNGELDTRKRRKMYDGDFFEFNQEYYVVVCDAPVQQPNREAPPKAQQDAEVSQASKPAKDKGSDKAARHGSAQPVQQKTPDTAAKKNEIGRSQIDFL
ncbi:RNA-binding S4 domain-containing protein [Vibrio ostreicida]|uniref:RNA-binding S4 domain-containing protein n=1 Tax=Vibrio ostreicida TaxID=526588 RepID=UPI003B59A7A3